MVVIIEQIKLFIGLKFKITEGRPYTEFGHNSFKKLVCIYPGSRQPTVLAGAPAHGHSNDVLYMKQTLKWKNS